MQIRRRDACPINNLLSGAQATHRSPNVVPELAIIFAPSPRVCQRALRNIPGSDPKGQVGRGSSPAIGQRTRVGFGKEARGSCFSSASGEVQEAGKGALTRARHPYIEVSPSSPGAPSVTGAPDSLMSSAGRVRTRGRAPCPAEADDLALLCGDRAPGPRLGSDRLVLGRLGTECAADDGRQRTSGQGDTTDYPDRRRHGRACPQCHTREEVVDGEQCEAGHRDGRHRHPTPQHPPGEACPRGVAAPVTGVHHDPRISAPRFPI